MRPLHIIMPMGGLGIRFREKGYDCPKPLIKVDESPMFLKAINSFSSIDCEKKFTFIVRFDHEVEYKIVENIKQYIPNGNFILLMENTRGAVETCLKAEPYIDDEDSIIILDCDLEFHSEKYFNDIKEDLNRSIDKLDIAGRLVSFPSNNPRYSYALVDEDGIVHRTAEKEVISNNAITGSYYFSSKQVFLNAAHELMKEFENGTCKAKEVYLSLLYNKIISNNLKIKLYSLDKYNSFGTPEELNEYLNKQKTKINGHSGCSINVKTLNDETIVEKKTDNLKYFSRLKKQMQKQIDFYNSNVIKNLSAPFVYNVVEKDNECIATMNYIDGCSFIDYFENCDEEDVVFFANKLIEFIDDEIKKSEIVKISGEVFNNKFNSVKDIIFSNKILNQDDEILSLIQDYRRIMDPEKTYYMPIGKCHGDLTMSNIIFKGNEYYLIDFLDSFIETPYMDIVKLRQDTKYNWSYLLIDNKKDIFDKSKKRLMKIDSMIVEHYKNDVNFKNSYAILQEMNFLRILQYAKKDKIIFYLKNILKNFLKSVKYK